MKFFKVILVISVLLVLPACTEKKPQKIDEPDIIMGRDCGIDKMQCCKEDPPCSFAQQCCVDPNDQTKNYCSDKCTCGGEREFCCKDGQKCQNGLSCFQGSCQACGQADQPCCDGSKCEGTMACNGSKCVPCGEPGNPCCENGKCKNDDKNNKDKAECYQGNCRICGWGGEPACVNEPRCVPGQLLNNDVCYQCGQYNQPCCTFDAKTGYDCDPSKNLRCYLGFCSN